jgi:hypothetical protein
MPLARHKVVALLPWCMVACWGCDGTSPAGGASDAQGPVDGAAPVTGWKPLFNGVDFDGWQRYLGKPSSAEPPLGIDNDPRAVFSIVTVDGEPAIRISGEVWGALISRSPYCNFHLRGQYRWGTQTWPPLSVLDSGIMYMSSGPLGAVNAGGNALSDPIGSGAFMVSMEFQLAPVDIGGMYNLGPIAFQQQSRVQSQGLPAAWNQVEIVVRPDSVTHLLNQQAVAVGSDFRLTWPGQAPVALSCGTLQLQSEGGEIFFRRLEIAVAP